MNQQKPTSTLTEMSYFYKVIYEIDGVQHTFEARAGNAGTAFAQCLKAYPEAKLIKATVEGHYGAGHGHMDHLPPPVQRAPMKEPRPARALRKKERGCEFGFYDEVVNPSP